MAELPTLTAILADMWLPILGARHSNTGMWIVILIIAAMAVNRRRRARPPEDDRR